MLPEVILRWDTKKVESMDGIFCWVKIYVKNVWDIIGISLG